MTQLKLLNSLFNNTTNIADGAIIEYKNQLVIEKVFSEGGYRINDYHTYPYRYIDLHAHGKFSYICIDYDSNDISNIIDNDKIPPPNVYIKSKSSGNYHLVYILENPVYKYGKAFPLDLFTDVKKRITRVIGGDPSYNNRYIYNPYNNSDYVTAVYHTKKYSLSDFFMYFDVDNATQISTKYDLQSDDEYPIFPVGMRNNLLFNSMRKFAYSNFIKCKTSGVSLYEAIFEYGLIKNDSVCEVPLTMQEVRSMSKSIDYFVSTKFSEKVYDAWIAENYNSEKQAFRGSMKNSKKREPAIRRICSDLKDLKPVNAKSVQSEYNVSSKTAYNWIKKAKIYLDTENITSREHKNIVQYAN